MHLFKKIFTKFEAMHILIIAGIIIIGSFLLIYLIDMRNVFGIRDFLWVRGDEWPFFWSHWFRNGGPIEMIQYVTLGLAAFIAIKNSTLIHSNANNFFWSIMGIAFILMLIEDAASPRHTIREYVQIFAGEEGQQGTFGTITELIYFALLASIPIYGLLRYGLRALVNFKSSRSYMLAGFFFYAVAAGASFIGSAFSSLLNRDVYTMMGEYLLNFMIEFGDQEISQFYLQNSDIISFYLMDSPVEESIELLGAALLLAACIAFYRKVQSKNDIKNETG